MIILDSSVLIAILLKEPDYENIIDRISTASEVAISTATELELHVVVTRKGIEAGVERLQAFLERIGAMSVPFTSEQLELAKAAFDRFGRTRHPAKLNFGDCFSYALARELNAPLLFVGDDFSQTDIRSAMVRT
ncbi:type II toxin-antitoxin system VapC family toxin [Pacificimonas sp. WHA3]|uniref:Ribonuclease VapC n=1 Tax=Pacificimonas pallii TaxID=2827236 RepID=A0ABS6SAX9_9SPHN|nr:type II toxin-antitoxin system VapC family toxin [Pacificimonas pallii]MBV7255499.1 type II toxin-antitoxin system VapC family toxin [Pacificimonas pallii]